MHLSLKQAKDEREEAEAHNPKRPGRRVAVPCEPPKRKTVQKQGKGGPKVVPNPSGEQEQREKREKEEEPVCEHDVGFDYTYSSSIGTGIRIKEQGGDWILDNPAELDDNKKYEVL